MNNPLPAHDSNSYNFLNEAQDLDTNSINYEAMSLKELNATIDSELLSETLSDILAMPACMRANAIADFEEIDPALGAKLRLEVLFTSN